MREHPNYRATRVKAGGAMAAARKQAEWERLLVALIDQFDGLSDREVAIAKAAKGGR